MNKPKIYRENIHKMRFGRDFYPEIFICQVHECCFLQLIKDFDAPFPKMEENRDDIRR